MNKAFTLIELLVVVLIIGILSAIALPQYTKTIKRSRGAQIVTLGRSFADAANRYYLENGSYTGLGLNNLDIKIPSVTMGNTGYRAGIDYAYNNEANVCYTKENGGSCDEGLGLWYELRSGKITAIKCIKDDTEKCQDYFPDAVYSSCMVFDMGSVDEDC